MKRCVDCGSAFAGEGWNCPFCGFRPRSQEGILQFSEPAGNDGFDPAAYDVLAELEERSFWFRARNELINWALWHHFPSAQSMLEVGCGTGYVLRGLRAAAPRLRLTGGELHLRGLAHAVRSLSDVDLFQFDARRIPFTEAFDVVGAFDVLEHIDEDEHVLAEMRQALRSDGGIILTVPQHPWLWSDADDFGEHKRRYRRAELAHKVTAAGFEIRRQTSFMTLLLPLMAAARVSQRLSRRAFDPAAEYHAARRIDRGLSLVADAERSLITRGLNLRVGGSLLVIAICR
ncbi:MAG: class I SAM-dependent methyltransferase [Solirubrobacteraceae bacterium]